MRDDLLKIQPGRHEVDSDRVFAIVEDAKGRDKKDAKLEAHEKYIDIQLVVKGTDNMGWKLRSCCSDISKPYDENMDILFFNDEPDAWIPVTTGMFAIFLPEDAHMPLISGGRLRKVIMKVAVDQ
jgi:YhcH/YjgK/YiaL family protein